MRVGRHHRRAARSAWSAHQPTEPRHPGAVGYDDADTAAESSETCSFRERPVWRRRPASPMRSASCRSTKLCTSSSGPATQDGSRRPCSRISRSALTMALVSSDDRTSAAARAWAHAMLPVTSSSKSARSKPTRSRSRTRRGRGRYRSDRTRVCARCPSSVWGFNTVHPPFSTERCTTPSRPDRAACAGVQDHRRGRIVDDRSPVAAAFKTAHSVSASNQREAFDQLHRRHGHFVDRHRHTTLETDGKARRLGRPHPAARCDPSGRPFTS